MSKRSIEALDERAMIGYRGSLATGTKYKTGSPFNPSDFDVDGFIVSDKLSLKFKPTANFRNGNSIPELNTLSMKPFTFRIFTSKEFEKIVKPNGFVVP